MIIIDTSVDLLLSAQVVFSLTHAALELVHLAFCLDPFFQCLFFLQLRFLSEQDLAIFDLRGLLEGHMDVDDCASDLQLTELARVDVEMISD